MESVSVLYEGLFSITGVETLQNDEGQSVMEFLVMMPVLLALVVLVVKIHTAIQISIVNQKYARGRTLFLTYNSPVYPARLGSRDLGPNGLATTELINKHYNRMVIGVSALTVSAEEDFGSLTPRALTQLVARSRATATGSNEDKSEPERRSLVRIRTTVALCTPSWVIRMGSRYESWASSQDLLGSEFSPASFAYCRSPLDE